MQKLIKLIEKKWINKLVEIDDGTTTSVGVLHSLTWHLGNDIYQGGQVKLKAKIKPLYEEDIADNDHDDEGFIYVIFNLSIRFRELNEDGTYKNEEY